MDKELLRVSDVMECTSLGRSKLYELIRDGSLPAVHIGRSIRIPASSVRRFVAELVAEQVGEQGN